MMSDLLGVIGLLIVLLIIAAVYLFPRYMPYHGGSHD